MCMRKCVLSHVRSHSGSQVRRNSTNFAKCLTTFARCLTKVLKQRDGRANHLYYYTWAVEPGHPLEMTWQHNADHTEAAASDTKLYHLVFLTFAAHSCLQSSHREGCGPSHLLLEVASVVPLLFWLHPHSTATLPSCSLHHL